MSLARWLYRRLRPPLARGVRQRLDHRILTRTDVLNTPSNSWTVLPFGTAEQYAFDRPAHVGELSAEIEAKVGTCTVPRPFVLEVRNATLVGPSALAFVNGAVLLESALGGHERLIDASVRALLAGQLPVESRLQRPDRRYANPVFRLVGPWATEYYHWLTDYLVQVFAVETYREQTGRDPLVLIPPDPPNWVRESLSLVGIDPARTVEWSSTRARCDRLVVGALRRHTASTGDGYIHSPAAMARLGSRLRSAVTADADARDDAPTRLYVSRADAADRRVRNEDALVATLEAYGFERIVPTNHSFADQVRAFSDADVVVGPHGAGLTNLIFAEETTLVELFGAYRNACFFALARGMGHDYVSVACRAEGTDLVVDTAAIDALLADLLDGS
jgi:hypothetical protein